MKREFVYSKQASAELREILRYTLQNWGAAQARSYAQAIDSAVESLAKGQGGYQDWSALIPGLRSKVVVSHVVFCVYRPDQKALVLAIFHQRMDLMTRLRARLSE